MEIVKFVIFNAPRVGSNMLCTMLDNHPGILCHHEIFNPHVIGVARSLQNDPSFHIATLEEREQNPQKILESVWQQNLGNAIVGLKLCWRQHSIYRQILEDKDIRKIILKRKNRIRSYVSLLLARKTKEWVIYEGDSIANAKPKVHIDINDLWSVIKFNKDYYYELENVMENSAQSWKEVWYEDLFEETFRLDILKFLDISAIHPSHMQSGTLRLNDRPLNELIENYEEIVASLKGTELQNEIENG